MYHTSKWTWSSVDHIPTSKHSLLTVLWDTSSLQFSLPCYWHNVYHLLSPMKKVLRGKYYANHDKWKLQWWSVSKNSKQNFTRQGYMLLFKSGTLLLREMVTMLRSRDVIHRGSVSFWCMIYIPVLIIIPLLKKKALLFNSPLYNINWFM